MQEQMAPREAVTLLSTAALNLSGQVSGPLVCYGIARGGHDHDPDRGHGHGHGHREYRAEVARPGICRLGLGLDRPYLFPSGPLETGCGDSDRLDHHKVFAHDLYLGPNRLVHLCLLCHA